MLMNFDANLINRPMCSSKKRISAIYTSVNRNRIRSFFFSISKIDEMTNYVFETTSANK